MKVRLVARTEFVMPEGEDISPWVPDVDGGPALVEFAGRACYQSWTKPNPRTATNEGYIAHIIEVGHYSVLEHGQLSFYFTGISRSLTHELIRHRHFSYSQLSQRYVDSKDVKMVCPEIIAEDYDLKRLWDQIVGTARAGYVTLNEQLRSKIESLPDEVSRTLKTKLARQAARSVLPNATETRIIVTGNYRAWRHFFALRATEHADVEIRELAIETLRAMKAEVPQIVDDYKIVELTDGTEIAHSPYAEHE